MIINEENLVKAGYISVNNMLNKHKFYDYYLKSYQKSIKDNKGIKYFITIDFYDLSKLNTDVGIQFQTQVQFNSENGFTFNVDGFNDKEITIEALEDFYEKIWSTLKCRYYE